MELIGATQLLDSFPDLPIVTSKTRVVYQPTCGAGKVNERDSNQYWRGLMPGASGQTTEFPWGFRGLPVVRIVPEEGVDERFARWFLAAAARLGLYKHRV